MTKLSKFINGIWKFIENSVINKKKQRAIQVTEKVYGKTHPEVAEVSNSMG